MKVKGPVSMLGLRIVIAVLLTVFMTFLGVPFSVIDDMVAYDKDFIKDVTAIFLAIFLLLTYIQVYNNYLDRNYNWQQQIWYRLLYQFTGGILLPAIFVWLYIYGYRVLIFKNGYPADGAILNKRLSS